MVSSALPPLPAAPAPAAAALPVGTDLPTEDQVTEMIVGRMGWHVQGHQRPVALAALAVRDGTAMQLTSVHEERTRLHNAYVSEALGMTLPPAPGRQRLVMFRRRLASVWHVRWELQRKEVLWRLAIDGIGMLGNTHIHGSTPEACVCGAYPPQPLPAAAAAAQQPAPALPSPRRHHFWDCPIARSVVELLQDTVNASREDGGCPVQCHHVWLLESPDPAQIQQCVWEVVALAALNAMESARRYMRARRPFAAGALERAKAVALASLRGLLSDFASLGVPRRKRDKAWAKVHDTHPFLCVRGDRLVVSIPDVRAPEDM